MNSFETHGIYHLSASSLNTYAAEPAIWVMERLLKKRTPVGASAHRGSAVEYGVQTGLAGSSVEHAQLAAMVRFQELTALSGDPNREKEGAAIEDMVKVALSELSQYGTPSHYQKRIEYPLPGVPVPLLGFSDFEWEQHGIVLDLKTQLRLTSEITVAHARQVAAYIYGTNSEARVCYVTPKKCGVYRLETPEVHMAALTQIAQRLGRFLAISSDPMKLASMVVPDYDSFYWNNPVARAMGREVYGF